jgi:hypothetical protein
VKLVAMSGPLKEHRRERALEAQNYGLDPAAAGA